MIKKIFSTIGAVIMLANISYASNLGMAKNSFTQTDSSVQKELKTKKDFEQMLRDLKKGAKLGDMASLFYLGFIYYDGITLDDGTKIEADRLQAKKNLLEAISLGSKEAAALLVAKEIESKKTEEVVITLSAIQNSNVSVIDKDYFSMVLAGYVLDFDITDANAIEVATKWLYEAEKKRPTPKMQLLLAYIYKKLGNLDAANMYLNKACSHSEMKETCEKIMEMESANEQTCQER